MEEKYIIKKEHRSEFKESFIYDEDDKTKRLFRSKLDARIYLKQYCENDLEYLYVIQSVFCIV